MQMSHRRSEAFLTRIPTHTMGEKMSESPNCLASREMSIKTFMFRLFSPKKAFAIHMNDEKVRLPLLPSRLARCLVDMMMKMKAKATKRNSNFQQWLMLLFAGRICCETFLLSFLSLCSLSIAWMCSRPTKEGRLVEQKKISFSRFAFLCVSCSQSQSEMRDGLREKQEV